MNNEIKEFSNRISIRENEISSQLKNLESKIGKFTNWAWTFVWIGIAVTIFAIIYFFCNNSESGYAINLLGDFMAGTVASLWALAGLFFIYVAFLGQKQQLLNQQLEIMYSQLEVKYTRLELEGQKNEMKEQNITLGRQRIENTFFQLISLHHQIINGIDIRQGSHVTNQGRDVFRHIYKDFWGLIRKSNNSIQTLNKDYLYYYKEYESDLGHYFRNLYRIIKFIDNVPFLSYDEKYDYICILRAQLSSSELLLLFYNCISENGLEKFKPLIEKYHFFKNLPENELGNNTHRQFYNESAFIKTETN
jgi:hypothetical protein